MDVYSSILSAFTKVGGLDDAFIEVGSSSSYGILIITEDERICDEYGDCVIPFYECTLFFVGLLLPLSAFELEI